MCEEEKRFLSVKEAAAYLNFPERTVRDFIAGGQIKAVLPRGCARGYRIRREEVERFVAEELVPAPTVGCQSR